MSDKDNDTASSKMTFSLKMVGGGKSNNKKKKISLSKGFEEDDDEENDEDDETSWINPDIPREPLVIPVQQNSRLALVEQQQQNVPQETTTTTTTTMMMTIKKEEVEKPTVNDAAPNVSAEDQAAIEALQAEAGGVTKSETTTSKMVIEKTQNTFQHDKKEEVVLLDSEQESKQQLQQELDKLAPELSVDSKTYRQVPIAEFGAAMLRGMGWQGKHDSNSANDDDTSNMPRPSRLGLGATPKLLLDAPTHGNRKKPRRQDQVEKEKRLKEQQQEYEAQRQKMIKLDKQQTTQVGSIVRIMNNDNDDDDNNKNNRAIIRQWQGVPGLNMILIQKEKSKELIKVKRGSVQLIDRSELLEHPFEEPKMSSKTTATNNETKYMGERSENTKDRENENRSSSNHRRRSNENDSDDDDDKHKYYNDDEEDDRRHRKRQRKSENDDESSSRYYSDSRGSSGRRHRDDDHRRDRDRHRKETDNKRDRHHRYERDENDDDYDKSSNGDSRKKRRREKSSRSDYDDEKDYHRKQHGRRREKEKEEQQQPPRTWLIPNIRVRIVSSKYGKSNYKEKGVVVDVSVKGTATLSMTHSGQVLHVPERHLETALPKVGGNACILTGTHRFAKGRLLERDSRANKGSVQVFEDMNIVTTSLDDMAEWCGPLDDDLME